MNIIKYFLEYIPSSTTVINPISLGTYCWKEKTTSIMAPSADTSFAGHVANQFTSYEHDRKTASKDTLYATRYVGIAFNHDI